MTITLIFLSLKYWGTLLWTLLIWQTELWANVVTWYFSMKTSERTNPDICVCHVVLFFRTVTTTPSSFRWVIWIVVWHSFPLQKTSDSFHFFPEKASLLWPRQHHGPVLLYNISSGNKLHNTTINSINLQYAQRTVWYRLDWVCNWDLVWDWVWVWV